jgi:Lrp/AsnC family leucine-responsive transcriptional regulator
MRSLDAIHRRILAALSADADITSAELGDRVGLSASAAHRRVTQLRDAGLIAGYRAVLSEEARGHPTLVLVSVTLKDQRQETMASFEREVVRVPEVRECYLMSGEADYQLHIEVSQRDTYERVHRESLAQLHGVTRLASHFVIRRVVTR